MTLRQRIEKNYYDCNVLVHSISSSASENVCLGDIICMLNQVDLLEVCTSAAAENCIRSVVFILNVLLTSCCCMYEYHDIS